MLYLHIKLTNAAKEMKKKLSQNEIQIDCQNIFNSFTRISSTQKQANSIWKLYLTEFDYAELFLSIPYAFKIYSAFAGRENSCCVTLENWI
jgi:hypothetical protein